MNRSDDMVRLYGEACSQTVAAHILSTSTRTIYNMVKDGRLASCCNGRMIDVRSICKYIEEPEYKPGRGRWYV